MQCRRPNECYDVKKRARLEAALLQQAEVRATLRLKESMSVGGSQGNESQSSEIPEDSNLNGKDDNDDLIANLLLPGVEEANVNNSNVKELGSNGEDADNTDFRDDLGNRNENKSFE